VNAWLARNLRITLHFTPTSGSWLNMVEIWTKTADQILPHAASGQRTSITRH
jgi:hypothetical protein